MISIGMIITTLATTLTTTTLAKGSIECVFSESTGAQLCLGAVGQLLIFHLTNTTNTSIRLKKDDKYLILKVAENQIKTRHEEYVNSAELFINGKIKLGDAAKKHSGDYLLEEFRSDGVLLKKVNVLLEIQAPVSKPAVSQMCLSPVEVNISCSSEGDGVEFTLTLNGVSLVQTRIHRQFPSNRTEYKTERDEPSVSNVIIGFNEQLTGNLVCHVWNNVSRDETVVHLTDCKDMASPFPLMIVALTASTVTILLVALCLGVTKLHNKPTATAVSNDDDTDEGIIYTSVRIKRKTSKTGPDSHQNATEFSPTSFLSTSPVSTSNISLAANLTLK